MPFPPWGSQGEYGTPGLTFRVVNRHPLLRFLRCSSAAPAVSRAVGIWKTFTISAFDTPNLQGVTTEQLLAMSDDELAIAQAPYLVTRRWVKERYQRWGPNHPMYRARVLGEFPEQSEVSVYSLSWIEKASQEGPEIPNDGSVRVIQVGIDVAMSERICGTRDTKYTASTLAPLH